MATQQVTTSPRTRRTRCSIYWWALVWIAPALILETTFFLYPLFNSILLRFYNSTLTTFVGLRNYQQVFSNPNFLEVIRNNLLWLVLATILAVGLGLVIAALVDRVKTESIVKSALFLPMAISFVAAGIIWRFVYKFDPADQP